ncbi:uncharacterized protein LOC120838976 [Ixodes scapularis]|uniref:uncharacterized protein LOC120838976 n=1 Tax=Ixodes scapularis TaxID=6945 RepID=UPI001A9DA63F|nr:uncharacterized protein LOC120838976 [Ixodes scapularis]
MLALCLKGEALSVVGRLSPEESVDYDAVKRALMRRFRLTADGFREKFRNARPEGGETGAQYAARLASLFDRWVELSETAKQYDTLRDLLLAEQFLKGCSPKLALFIKERTTKTLADMADLADRYLEAQGTQSLGKKVEEKKPTSEPPRPVDKKSTRQRPPLRCFLCNRLGHRAADCRDKVTTKASCWRCGQTGHAANSCQEGSKGRSQASCCVATEPTKKKEVVVQDGYVELKNGDRLPVVNSTIEEEETNLTNGVPVRAGRVGTRSVTVLRDTGCNTVVVRKNLISKEELTGTSKAVYLADGTVKMLPEARLLVRSPFFSGEVTALCMESPLYDIILGNIPGVRAAADPDPEWDAEPAAEESRPETDVRNEERTVTAAVETRLQKKAAEHKTTVPTPLRVSEVQEGAVTPDTLKREQQNDSSLRTCFQNVGKTMTGKKRKHSCMFVVRNGILFRSYRTSPGREVHQLVVPKKFRTTILKMAHDGILAGHQGAQKTVNRVLEEFFWPGVGADVKRFVKSCDRCQRTTPKGKVPKMPLGSMPLIETPFQRVAIDIVGPISPTTKRGNKYILTMVNYATRYPDAVALPNISTERVAEALVEMFTRTGVPREVLSDRGSNFTSDVIKEVGRLLSMRQLFTTPYHPMGNGLVEKFNGTLKTMLKRMCQEKPADWDRYLAPLLFAYREVPQASLGFSPFELLYGRNVRGPLSVLKELWTNEALEEETKTTYEYVFELRNKLEDTCKIAHEELERASERYRRCFDRKARHRHIGVGDLVLILLPTDQNKLLMQWKGPYPVVGQKGPLDYEVDLGHGIKLFHGNMLKKYEERAPDEVPAACTVVALEESEGEGGFPMLRLQSTETASDVVFAPGLASECRKEAEALVQDYRAIFSDVPGRTDLIKCHLKLETDKPTDHEPLQYIKQTRHANARVMRWSLKLQEYDFKVQYIKGSENVGADYLSRM